MREQEIKKFKIKVDTHDIQVSALEKNLFRISFIDIDLGNICKKIVSGSLMWISTTGLKPDLVYKIGEQIDQYLLY